MEEPNKDKDKEKDPSNPKSKEEEKDPSKLEGEEELPKEKSLEEEVAEEQDKKYLAKIIVENQTVMTELKEDIKSILSHLNLNGTGLTDSKTTKTPKKEEEDDINDDMVYIKN